MYEDRARIGAIDLPSLKKIRPRFVATYGRDLNEEERRFYLMMLDLLGRPAQSDDTDDE